VYRRLGIVVLLILGLAAVAFIALHHAYRELAP
jgi:hypothetical protein